MSNYNLQQSWPQELNCMYIGNMEDLWNDREKLRENHSNEAYVTVRDYHIAGWLFSKLSISPPKMS